MDNQLVYLENKEIVCNSLQVAEKFEKRHNNVLRDIANLLKNEQVKKREIFKESEYKDSRGRTYTNARADYVEWKGGKQNE